MFDFFNRNKMDVDICRKKKELEELTSKITIAQNEFDCEVHFIEEDDED